jgi:hypothetical protein
MDPALARLVLDSSCQAVGPDGTGKYYNPQSSFTKCGTDDAAFAKLIAQYGFALAPTAMHSARTTGYGGFEVGIEGAFTKIDSEERYWQEGTQGPQDQVTKDFSIRNGSPDDVIQNYSLKIRKGFPWGFEITGVVGYVGNTNIVTAGADVRLSLLEGFRTGIPAIFPDLAVGGAVRTITGTEELQLTIVGVDGQLSKPIPVGGAVILTPYVGYQWIKIFGDSGLIDLTPNTDSVNYCNYRGPNSPAYHDTNKTIDTNNTPDNPDDDTPFYDGQPVCEGGVSADFNNTVVFDQVRLDRHRLNFGLQLRFQMVKFGAHFLFDLASPADVNAPETPAGGPAPVNVFDGVDKQWTLAFDLGAQF